MPMGRGDPGAGGTSGGARAAPRNVVTAPKVSWSGVKPSNAPYHIIPRSAPQSYVNRVRASNNAANPPAARAIANVAKAAAAVTKPASDPYGFKAAKAFKEAQQQQAALKMLISGPGARYSKTELAATPSIAPVTGPLKTVHSGGDALAALMAGDIGSSGLGKLAGKLGGEIVNLPVSTLKGVTQLGGSMASDAFKSLTGHGVNAHATTDMLLAAAKQDPLVNLVTGHPSRALQLAGQNPLGAGLDVLGGYGVAGRAGGALARSGTLGERAAAATQLARSRELAPGIPGTAVAKPYSANVFNQGLQKLSEANPALRANSPLRFVDKTGLTGVTSQLRKQAAMLYGPMKSRTARETVQTAKELKATKPSNVEANVVPYATAFGISSKDQLAQHLQQLLDARAGAYGPKGKYLDQHIANIQAALNKSGYNEASVQAAAQAYAARQAGLEAHKVHLGMYTQPELQAALEKQYALEAIPNTHLLKAQKHPAYNLEKRRAGAAVREAQKTLDTVKQAAAKDQGAHTGASAALAQAANRLPVHPVNDSLGNHLLDLRTAIEQSRAKAKGNNAISIGAAKSNLADAQHEFKLIKENPRMIGGLVAHDPNALPLTSGPLKGLGVRPLSSDEIQAHMAANPNAISYLKMTNPERQRGITDLFAQDQPRSAVTGKTYTGLAAKTGDYVPGYKGLVRSQRSDVRRIGEQRTKQAAIDRFSLKDPAGDKQHFNVHDAATAAKAYEQEHGIPMSSVKDTAAGNDKYVIMPQAVTKEIQAQAKLENPTALGRGQMRVNRAFRNTVLTMSPKLPVMHTVENIVRGLRIGANPQTYRLARHGLAAMSEDQRAYVQDVATPGGMSGHQARLSQEDLGHLNPDQSTLQRTALAPIHAWSAFSDKIIGFQRAIEQHAQTAALGVHMRQQLQQWGIGWADANTAVGKYAEMLAKGYADPAVVEDAGRFIHNTMGQYNNFTARQRFVISRIAPFAPWYRNAVQLVYKELPLGSPLRMALVQDVQQANAPQWNAIHSGLPTDMQTFANLGPGHWLDVGKFTPIGLEKNPLQEGVPLLFPQYQGAALALAGKDPFMSDFKGPNTPYGKQAIEPLSGGAAVQAVDQLLEGVAGPAAAIARALQNKGGTLYNTSLPLFGQTHIKPGTEHGPHNVLGGLAKGFNPFHGVYFGGSGAGSKGITLGGGSGSSAGSGGSIQLGGGSGSSGSSTQLGSAPVGKRRYLRA